VAAKAVGLAAIIFEGPLGELLHAEGAHKVLGVEALANGRDAPAEHGLEAGRAQGATLRVVVLLTVGLALIVEEAASSKGLLALHAGKAVRVPLPAERRDTVGHDGLLATAALGRKHVEVIFLTVSLAVLFHKASCSH